MSRRGLALAWPALARACGTAVGAEGACAGGGGAVQGSVAAAATVAGPVVAAAAVATQPDRQALVQAQLQPLSSQLLHQYHGPAAVPLLLHARCFSASASDGGPPSGSGSSGGEGGGETRMSLGEALNRLVDAAIEKVEAGDLKEAVSLLKEGLNTFEPLFPNSPELGELHNQAALLLLFQDAAEEAAHHAQVSLEATRRHFGSASILTAHRLLRLGVARFAQGKLADAAGLLREAHDLLRAAQQASASSAAAAAAAASQEGGEAGAAAEAGFYLDCVAQAHVRDAAGVATLRPSLRDNLHALKDAYGGDSMIVLLALRQHSRLVHSALEQTDFAVGEALLRQHIGLLAEAAGPEAEDVAVATYKLATYYYANDMLADAGAAVRQAAVAMRRHYPDEHDMVVLCKHRLGMICAASGEHRAAKQLLTASRAHFAEGAGGQGMLAKEADIGLAMARFREADASNSPKKAERQLEALEALRTEIDTLAGAIGHGHMLVQGATRYYGQLSKLVR